MLHTTANTSKAMHLQFIPSHAVLIARSL
jgi:hypothetical protein